MQLQLKYEEFSFIATQAVDTQTQSAAMQLLIYAKCVLDVCPTVMVINVSYH